MTYDATAADARGPERRWGAAAVLLAAVLAGGIVVAGSASGGSAASGSASAAARALAGGTAPQPVDAPAPGYAVPDLDPAGGAS